MPCEIEINQTESWDGQFNRFGRQWGYYRFFDIPEEIKKLLDKEQPLKKLSDPPSDYALYLAKEFEKNPSSERVGKPPIGMTIGDSRFDISKDGLTTKFEYKFVMPKPPSDDPQPHIVVGD